MVFCYWFYADLLILILVGSYFTTASSFISIAVSFLRAAENFLSVANVFLSVANAFISVVGTLISVADFYSRDFWAINSITGSVNSLLLGINSTAIGLITMLGKVLSIASINFSTAGKHSRDCRFCF